jgi:D-arabinose 5-phosphate isomerase GutQ
MLIVISKSGETQKVIEKMHFSRERMIPTILFTGNSQSLILSALLLMIPEESAALTKRVLIPLTSSFL